jgi:transposase-like protein
MKDAIRGQYTLEFKQEAVRLVQGGETVAAAAKSLGISGQTLHNWVKANAAGQLREVAGKAVSAEQMEITRLKAELARMCSSCDLIGRTASGDVSVAPVGMIRRR